MAFFYVRLKLLQQIEQNMKSIRCLYLKMIYQVQWLKQNQTRINTRHIHMNIFIIMHAFISTNIAYTHFLTLLCTVSHKRGELRMFLRHFFLMGKTMLTSSKTNTWGGKYGGKQRITESKMTYTFLQLISRRDQPIFFFLKE